MPFIPHTDVEVQEMLATLGVYTIDDLFDEIPSHLKTTELNYVSSGLTEMERTLITEQRGQKIKKDFALLVRCL